MLICHLNTTYESQYYELLAHNSDFHMSYVITYDISKEHDMCVQVVSNDCKKLQI